MIRTDAFTHLFPPAYFERIQELIPNKGPIKRWLTIPTLYDVEARLRMIDSFGDYQQILSNSQPPIEQICGPEDSPALARLANDGFAELCRKYPDHFPTFVASLPMNNTRASIEEIDRCVEELGAGGVQFFTNVDGAPLDHDDYFPIFERMAHHDLPIWLHPTRGAKFSDYAKEEKSKYEVWWTFGWPYETSAAMSHIVFSKIFEKLPDLKIITHHMGAMVPFFEGRVGPGWDQLGSRTSDEDYDGLLASLQKRPVDYFKMFYADTALFGSLSATKCGFDFFGADKIIFASDCPFDPEGGYQFIRDTMNVLDQMDLTPQDRENVMGGNIRRMMKVKV
ncbi:amidohydrolase family protein [Falsirhodobacter xinxiangensis]|uniref:amidohydrolase family protein n=1 Tax=Falsirhodobacter xinxiangensis TaxID=2530049 RepID=UPI0010AB4A54|nr:amidohydrolase family protein [Rhodobacter xinxiangensis]